MGLEKRQILKQTAMRAERLAKKHEEVGSQQKVIDHYKKEAKVCWRMAKEDIMASTCKDKLNHAKARKGLFYHVWRFLVWLVFWPIRKAPKRIRTSLIWIWGVLVMVWEKLPLPKPVRENPWILLTVWWAAELGVSIIIWIATAGLWPSVATTYLFLVYTILEKGRRDFG